jgi:hypothetical protein
LHRASAAGVPAPPVAVLVVLAEHGFALSRTGSDASRDEDHPQRLPVTARTLKLALARCAPERDKLFGDASCAVKPPTWQPKPPFSGLGLAHGLELRRDVGDQLQYGLLPAQSI